MRNLILLFLATSFSPAFAVEYTTQNCPTISLDAPGGTASGIPLSDQGQLPACYSYNASFLASVWARTQWSSSAPQYARFHDVPLRTYQQIVASAQYSQILDADRGRTCQVIEFILARERGKFSAKAAEALRIPECEMFGLVKNEQTNQYDLLDAPVIEQHMHDRLMQTNALPIGIEYCSGVHYDPAQNYIVNRVFDNPLTYLNDDNAMLKNFDSGCGFHSTAIVGQQLHKDGCYFKIRNTDKEYDWVESGALARNTLRVISLIPAAAESTPQRLADSSN